MRVAAARVAADHAPHLEAARVLREQVESKMLGGASQIVSTIRVKCNGT